MFDPNQFADFSTDQTNDTQLRPVPEGEYTAVIQSYEPRTWTSRDDPTKSGVALDIKWEIDDEALKQELGRKPTIKQGVMLDLTEDGKGLDMGKGRNVGLGQLREALGLNQPGQRFGFAMLPGGIARVKVGHRPDKEKTNPDGSPVVYAEVKGVAKP